MYSNTRFGNVTIIAVEALTDFPVQDVDYTCLIDLILIAVLVVLREQPLKVCIALFK